MASCGLASALGIFCRDHCHPERLPPGAEPTSTVWRCGLSDKLPIHPALIQPGLPGVTYQNVDWLRASVLSLDYLYCVGWRNPVCLPSSSTLTEAQQSVIKRMADPVDSFIAQEDRMSTCSTASAKLKSRKFDYCGEVIERMEDLVTEKVLKAWPQPGNAAVVDLQACLPDDLAAELNSPRSFLIPKVDLPDRRRGSKVWASEHEWFKLVKAGFERGLFTSVDDKDVPTDKRRFAITNGAGAVPKVKVVGGREDVGQSFISILCPMNDALRILPGAQDSLPYIGQLTAVVADPDSYLVLDSEDLQSPVQNAEGLASVFCVHARSQRRCFGDPAARCCDRPMGWTSAVTLTQAAVRHIAYSVANVPSRGDVRKDAPLPDEGSHTILSWTTLTRSGASSGRSPRHQRESLPRTTRSSLMPATGNLGCNSADP